jgi:arabinogalactan oligomer/maltooligosaccharide transport system permease protein
MEKKQIKLFPVVVKYTVLIFVTIITIYPVIRIISVSLRPGNLLLTTSLDLIPDNATLESFRILFFERPFLRWMLNSTIVSVAVTLVGVGFASTAGYAFSRYSFYGRKSGMILLIVSQMFPVTMLLLPLFIMLVKLRIYDTFLGLIVIYTTTALPFCVWQMKGYYDTIPVSLEDAAKIDGCTPFQAFYKIIMPLASPALVITALFSFMSAWSEYLVAAVVISDSKLFTLPLGLKQFQSSYTTEWGLYAAGAVIVSIPVVLLFMALSRWLVGGLTLGSVKG